MKTAQLIVRSLPAVLCTAALALTISWVWLLRQGGYILPTPDQAQQAILPAIHKYSAVIVKPLQPTDLQIGNIIAYQQGSEISISRIVKIGHQLTIRDDSSTESVSINPNQVIGQIAAVLPYFGPPLDALRHRVVLFSLIYLPSLAFISREIRKLAAIFRQPHYHLSNHRC